METKHPVVLVPTGTTIVTEERLIDHLKTFRNVNTVANLLGVSRFVIYRFLQSRGYRLYNGMPYREKTSRD